MAYRYPYLNNAYCLYTVPTDMSWLGSRYKVFITDHDGIVTANYSAAIAANPLFQFYSYMSGSGIYRYNYGGWIQNLWAAYLAAGKTKENAWWHYNSAKTFIRTPRSTAQLVNGQTVGVVPAYTSLPLRSRMVSAGWGSAYDSGAKTISSIERLASPANTVEVTFATAHGFEVGDWVEIAGVTGGATSFNGVFDITSLPTTLKIRYSQTGAAESGSGGTARHQAWKGMCINYKAVDWRDFLESIIATYCTDAVGNKAHGYFFDSILNQAIHKSGDSTYDSQEFEKCKEYLDDGGSGTYNAAAINAWLIGYINPWLDHIRAAFATFRGSAAYSAVNGDGYAYVGDAQYAAAYNQTGVGADLILLEIGIGPSGADPTDMEARWKRQWSYMDTYAKKLIFQSISYASLGTSNWHDVAVSWINESGNIWYTDAWTAYPKGAITTLDIGSWYGSRKETKEELTSSGYFYQDQSTGRVYVYSATQPTGNITLTGLEPFRMLALAEYLVIGQHANSYFFYFKSGSIYNIQPSNSIHCWFDAIDYVGLNIGAPAVGGVKSDGTLGTDLWSESCATSSKAYIFWTKTVSAKIHNVYARRFANGYALFRLRSEASSYGIIGSDPVAIPIPFTYRVLYSDGSVGPNTTEPFTLAQGEGAVLLAGTQQNPELPPIATPTTFKEIGMGLEITQQGYVNRRYGKRELKVRTPAYLEGAFSPLNVVADPGASGAIPVTKSAIVAIVTAGAETRTLAAPSFEGQMMCISMKTAVGAMTLTCATTLNQAGNNTAVMTPAGDTLLLVAVYIGANLRWRVMGNDGAVLSTV